MAFEHTKVQTVSLVFISVVTLGLLLHMVKSFMVPFAASILLSFLLVPAAEYLDKRKCPCFLSNIIILTLTGVAISFLGLLLYEAFTSVTSKVPFYMNKYRSFVGSIITFLDRNLPVDLGSQTKQLSVQQVFELISPSSMVSTINQSIGSVVSFVSALTLLFIFLIFIMGSRRILLDKLYSFFHAQRSASNSHFMVLQTISLQIKKYLFLKTIISICTGAAFGFVGFIMGLDFPIVWGFVGFLFNFVPTLGPIVASVPVIILAFLQFDSAWWALLTSFLMSGVQFTSGNFVEPMIMGSGLNLNIIAILLSLLLWGLIWGIPGMLLAVPITAAINIVFSNIHGLRSFSVLLSK